MMGPDDDEALHDQPAILPIQPLPKRFQRHQQPEQTSA
jgi:hypothetical protein